MSESASHSRRWGILLTLVVVEFITGIVAILAVPFSRPDGLVARSGELFYLLHSVLGLVLSVIAVTVLLITPKSERIAYIASMGGLSGVVVAAGGGVLTTMHALRLMGMGLMLLGVMISAIAYLLPLVGNLTQIVVAHSEVEE